MQKRIQLKENEIKRKRKNKEKKTAMPYTPANTLTPDKESHPSMTYNAHTKSTQDRIAKTKGETINLPSNKDLPTVAKKKKRRKG